MGPKSMISSAARAYAPLSPDHRRAIAELMWTAREIALRIPSARRVMTAQIKHLAFYWTTSAFCPVRQVVIPDAIKFNVCFMHHTLAAHRLLGPADSDAQGVVHEHAVPRSVLATYVVDEASSIQDVVDTFHKHCVAVLVTEDEDKELNAGGFRDRMPAEWTWAGDPLARYVALRIRVLAPTNDAPCTCRS
ncbi:MAG TPA: hypothetical protein VFP84_16690 [Kofleriaceae bacterium]|nr:hypothetical protein [Kofleriaceae bacterium]